MSLAAVGLVKLVEDAEVVIYSARTSDLSPDFSEAEIGLVTIRKNDRTLLFRTVGPLADVNVVQPDHYLDHRFAIDDEFREAVTRGTRAGAWVGLIYRMAKQALDSGSFPDQLP